MKNSKFLMSVAVAGMLVGSQAALADHHNEKKAEEGKAGCSGKSKDEKHSCKSKDGKHSCKTTEGKKKGAEEEKHGCGANGCG
ncbi:MAG: hypothetical protein ACLGG7_09370 [Bacteriovoracia bacterium]